MLVRDGVDDLALLEMRYHAPRHSTEHFALTIITSLGCNFDCPYCFEARHPSIMNVDVKQGLLQAIDDKLKTVMDLSVSWFGGEPLVGKRPLLALADAFIDRCDRRG